jgi:hypothetical protein
VGRNASACLIWSAVTPTSCIAAVSSVRTSCAGLNQKGFMKVSRLKSETLTRVKKGITQRSSSRAFHSRTDPMTTL